MTENNTLQNDTYKQTELGPLPQEWEVVRLGDYLNPYKERVGINKGKFKPVAVGEKGLRFREDIYLHKKVLTNRTENYLIFPYSSICFGLGSRKIAVDVNEIKDSNYCVSPAYKVYLFDSEKINPKYFRFFIKYIVNIWGKRLLVVSVRQGKKIDENLLKQESITLPPLHEQKKIAYVLSVVHEAEEKTDKYIQTLKELKKSAIKHLFTYGAVPFDETDKVELKETEIGKVPKEWEVVRLGEVTEKTKQFDPRRQPDWRFKYIDVSAISSELLKIKNYIEYLGKNAPHRARNLVKANDIIFATVRPYLKRIAIIPENLDGQIVSTAFCIIRFNPSIAVPMYMFYTISKDDFIDRVSSNQRGSSYPAVTNKDILQQFIPLPPLHEQQRIASILSSIDEQIETMENKKKAIRELFNSLLKNLMTAKIRVNNLNLKYETVN